MDNEHTITLPKNLFDDNKFARNFIFSELNTCFEQYLGEFNMYPNEIIFNGKLGKKMYDSVHDLFEGNVYKCTANTEWSNSIIFKNNKKETVNIKDLKKKDKNPVCINQNEIYNTMHPGNLGSAISELIDMEYKMKDPSSFVIEKDIPTVMEFIVVQEFDPNDMILNNNLAEFTGF